VLSEPGNSTRGVFTWCQLFPHPTAALQWRTPKFWSLATKYKRRGAARYSTRTHFFSTSLVVRSGAAPAAPVDHWEQCSVGGIVAAALGFLAKCFRSCPSRPWTYVRVAYMLQRRGGGRTMRPRFARGWFLVRRPAQHPVPPRPVQQQCSVGAIVAAALDLVSRHAAFPLAKLALGRRCVLRNPSRTVRSGNRPGFSFED
jgi:hypothetical protein